MNKYLLPVLVALLPLLGFAHSPSASTTMLVEKDNHTWVLQISASLTAFQKEIQTHFSETPYKSPEEFQQMVLQHIKNNLEVSFNDGTKITLRQGKVKLGHETKVVFEVFGMPDEIQTLGVKNTAFSDIYKSQSAFIILKDGIEKKIFELNKDNAYGLKLQLAQGKLRQLGEARSAANLSPTLFFVTAFLILLLAVALVKGLQPLRIKNIQNEQHKNKQ